MSAQMNIGGAFGSLASGDIGGFFKNLFDDPEGTTKKILKDNFEGKITMAETIEKLSKEATGHASNGKMQKVIAILQQGGDPAGMIDQIDQLMDPKKAEERRRVGFEQATKLYDTMQGPGKHSSPIAF